MKKNKTTLTQTYGNMIRVACTAYFRSMGLSGEELQSIADELGISKSTVEGVVYKETGGLDTYAAVFAKLNKIDSNKIEQLIPSFLDNLYSKKPPKSYLKWQGIATKLTENKRLFWLSILEAAIDAERKFKSKSNK